MADCTTYKLGMKSLGYEPEEEDMSQTEEHEFYSGLIFKIVLGGGQESELPETQTDTGCGEKYQR